MIFFDFDGQKVALYLLFQVCWFQMVDISSENIIFITIMVFNSKFCWKTRENDTKIDFFQFWRPLGGAKHTVLTLLISIGSHLLCKYHIYDHNGTWFKILWKNTEKWPENRFFSILTATRWRYTHCFNFVGLQWFTSSL